MLLTSNTLLGLLVRYVNKYVSSEDADNDVMEKSKESPVCSQDLNSQSSMFDDFISTRTSTPATPRVPLNTMQEVNQYLTTVSSHNCNPISFWNSERGLDRLRSLALIVLSIPATSAPVERVFSAGGILMRPHRASLSADTLTELILLKCNIALPVREAQ